MNKINLWLVSFTILTLQAAQANTEVAKVNDKVITLEQVNARISEQARSGVPGSLSKKAAVDELIKREAAIQEAKRLKLDQDPAISERINNVLYFAVLEKKLGSDFEKITLSDAEARNWYEKNPEIRTSHIFIALPPSATAEDEKVATNKLNSLLAEIKSGKSSFAEVAQRNSEDPSAAMGGDLDYRLKDRLDPNYYRAALRLGKAGDISGIVRTPFGMHVIRLTGKHSWSEVDRQRVKRVILDEKRQEIVSNYLNDLRQKAKVTVNNGVIKE
jgi:parvulin-like peptidyl-prolyl isomerase